jgi:hypothetical protein
MKVKLPGAAESQCPLRTNARRSPYNRRATGHATADRVAIGVISLTSGRHKGNA